MNSTIIKNKVDTGQVILYRRVSTKAQAKDEFQHQLRCIKSKYTKFTIAGSTIDNITEVISGCADAEIRMASELGEGLKLLKRNPHAILLVSNADRIARRADIFLLIQRQGFGKRIYDASTGRCLDDIIQAGLHHAIEKQTEAQRASRQAGLERYRANGGVVGSTDIAKQSRHGTLKKKKLADDREAAVLAIVSRLTSQGRGQRPTRSAICDELVRQQIYTGQGRSFTQDRLSQLGKRSPHRWEYAFDSYFRPRRRIRKIIAATVSELRNRRERQAAMMRLGNGTPRSSIRTSIGFDTWMCSRLPHRWQADTASKRVCRYGCRGPPVRLEPSTGIRAMGPTSSGS